MPRLFVAVVPPPEVVEHLDDFLSVRRAAADFRWSAPDQWHVTLAFAASVPERALDELDDLLLEAAARRPSFGMRVTGGPQSVGEATGRAIRASIVVVVVLDMILTLVFWGGDAGFRVSG